MTADLFKEWLKAFDRQMRLVKRKVIILVENAVSHSHGDLQLKNVTLHFLPPNTTAHIQPMDAGIIKAFEVHYRKQLVQHYINSVEKDEDQSINLREALHIVKTAWDRLKASTIVNCYRHIQILPSPEEFDDDDVDVPLSRLQFNREEDEEDDIPLVELQRKMRQLPDTGSMTAEEYLAVDEEEETVQHLTDDDIMLLVSREEVIECIEEEEEKEVPKDINLREGDEFITGSVNVLEQTPSSATEEEKALCHEALDILWKVKDMVRRRQVREVQQKKMTYFFRQ